MAWLTDKINKYFIIYLNNCLPDCMADWIFTVWLTDEVNNYLTTSLINYLTDKVNSQILNYLYN
jgi:hypothetical protein